ncbi:hypothetical protein N7670_09830 [Stenotrophomonas maltophilia]|uniref:hypothetical protein n=1 Tax=Stenotrophomonas maltophilia TaxID=40324 RepID=UPI002449FE82|nr:hypothetical protein [Stenotrophomonas maltophilia]MDG9939670.1 hypothetical protein [Stenotrophomonas maltophilia]MDH0559511.1 hypothetical protein [Stenotrophomonas maltophilia]
MDMTKASVKKLLGLESDAELARFFEVSRGAVFHWPEDEAIPESRQWELKARRPELFRRRRTERPDAA